MLVTPPKKWSFASPSTRERCRDGRARDFEKRYSAEEKRGQKVHAGSVVITRNLGHRTTKGELGESSVNSIRIALVYIRGQDSPRAILHRGCRRADIYLSACGLWERSGESMVPLSPRIVLGSVRLLGAVGWVCLIVVSLGCAVSVF